MIAREAERCFREGLQQLEYGRAREALPLLASALRIQNNSDSSGFIQATYKSYHGLCQCLAGSEMYRGLCSCRQASKTDPTNPAIWFNLGRAAMIVSRRDEAHRAFRRGLQIQPGHPGITRALTTMGVRRGPVLGFLPRGSFVNVFLGRMRSSAKRRYSVSSSSRISESNSRLPCSRAFISAS